MLKNFESKEHQITKEVFTLGQKVVQSNKKAFEAIKNSDMELFSQAKRELNNFLNTSNKIDNLIISTLARHQPEAKDLRTLISYLKITNELNRAASNTKSFIKYFSSLSKDDLAQLQGIIELSKPLKKASLDAIEQAVAMILLDDTEEIDRLYGLVLVEENKTDDFYAMMEKELSSELSKELESSKGYLDTLTCLRRLEKIADRAVSIASLVHFANFGGDMYKNTEN